MKNLHRFLSFVVLLGLVIIFFNQILFANKIFVTPDFGRSDILHLNYPIKFFLSESLKNWQLPLWNPQIGNGYPQFAESQMGTFNPENLLLFGLLPMPLAFNLGLALIFFQTGVFTYLFCRSLKLSAAASLFSSIAFSFSAVFVTHIVHFNLIQTLSFLPLQMYLVEMFFQKLDAQKKKSPEALAKWGLFLSLAVAVQLFSGFYQVALYSLIAVFLYTLFKIWILKLGRVKKILILALFSISLTLGFALAAVQLLPSLELAQLSGRGGGVNYLEMMRFPLSPKHLITFVFPYFFGNPKLGTYPSFGNDWGIFWESSGYLGILPLILAIVAIIFLIKKNKTVLFLFLLLSLSLLLMFGRYSPLYLFFEFPPFDFFRVPARWIMVAVFSFSILGGFGFQFFIDKIQKFKLKNLIIVLVLLVSIFDLFFFGMNYNGTANPKEFLKDPETSTFLKNQMTPTKVFSLDNSEVWNSVFLKSGWQNIESYKVFLNNLNPNSNMIFKISNLLAYESILTKREQIIANSVSNDIQKNNDSLKLGNKTINILDLYGVNFLISAQKIDNEKFKETFSTQTNPSYKVYKNNNALPQIFLSKKTISAQSIPEYNLILNSPDFNPKDEVILEKKIEIKNPFQKADVKTLNITPEGTTAKVNLDGQGILVFSNSFYPGWKVLVDGRSQELLVANVNQMAVFLEAGDHKVIFYYDAQSFRKGLLITLISLGFPPIIFLLLSRRGKLFLIR